MKDKLDEFLRDAADAVEALEREDYDEGAGKTNIAYEEGLKLWSEYIDNNEFAVAFARAANDEATSLFEDDGEDDKALEALSYARRAIENVLRTEYTVSNRALYYSILDTVAFINDELAEDDKAYAAMQDELAVVNALHKDTKDEKWAEEKVKTLLLIAHLLIESERLDEAVPWVVECVSESKKNLDRIPTDEDRMNAYAAANRMAGDIFDSGERSSEALGYYRIARDTYHKINETAATPMFLDGEADMDLAVSSNAEDMEEAQNCLTDAIALKSKISEHLPWDTERKKQLRELKKLLREFGA